MYLADQTFTDHLSGMRDERKIACLFRDMQRIEDEGTLVPNSKICN